VGGVRTSARFTRCGRDRPIAFREEDPFKHDVEKRIPDSSKARDRLGWEPEVSIEESLDEYVDWYRTEVL